MTHALLDYLAIFGAEYLYVLLIVIMLIWFWRQTRTIQFEVALVSVIAVPLMYVMVLGAASVYSDPRPFVGGNFTPLIPHEPGNGFPSDHTILSAAISIVVSFYDRRTAFILWILSGVVGTCRVYAGVHHATDILASASIAVACGLFVYLVIRPKLLGRRFVERLRVRWASG